MYAVKNYSTGDTWVVNGSLEIGEDGVLKVNGTIIDLTNMYTKTEIDTLFDGIEVILDTKLTAYKAALQADSTAVDIPGIVADLNALIAKLKAAGIMANE